MRACLINYSSVWKANNGVFEYMFIEHYSCLQGEKIFTVVEYD